MPGSGALPRDPQAAQRDDGGKPPRPDRAPQRGPQDPRDPRAAAAAAPDQRPTRAAPHRSRQGRGRLSSRKRRQGVDRRRERLPARHALRRAAAASPQRGRDRGSARGGPRPLEHRGPPHGRAAAAGWPRRECDRDGLPLAHPRHRRHHAAGGHPHRGDRQARVRDRRDDQARRRGDRRGSEPRGGPVAETGLPPGR